MTLGREDWVGEVDVGDVAVENGRAEWRSYYVSKHCCRLFLLNLTQLC